MQAVLKFVFRNWFAIVLIVLGIIGGAYISNTVNQVQDFFFPEAAAYVRSPQGIANSIQGIGQLVTVRQEIVHTDISVEIHGGFLNSEYYGANHKAISVIEAGINLDAIDADDIRLEEDSYILTLPAPVITSCRVEYIDQSEHSLTLLQADWDMVRQIAQAEAIMQSAVYFEGVLERAKEETALRLGDFARQLTGKPTRVEFAARAGELELPESCQPFTPDGWGKDADGAWKRLG